MAAITILLNGVVREIPGDASLDQLLDLFSLPKQRIAIELNNHVIRRADWRETKLTDNDKIEVVHFVGGG